MPSIVTHNLFAQDVLSHIPKKEKEIILLAKEHYFIFAQSFDNLFYYNFFKGPYGKKIRSFGITNQKREIDTFFINIIEYIKANKLESEPQIIALLIGSLTHYALDHTCHPYIIYKTKHYNREKLKSLKYAGFHEKLEVEIDAYMYEEKTGQKLYKASLADTLLPKVKFNQNLLNILDYTYQNTFKQENMGKKYYKSVQTGHFILKFFVTDHYGMKKKIYRIYDHIFNQRRYQYLDFYIKETNLNNLNLDHELWYYPSDPKIKKTESFLELYDQAIINANTYIKASLDYLHNKISLTQLKKEIKDYNYATGLSWKRK